MGKATDKMLAAKRLLQNAMLVGGTEYAKRRQDGSKPIVDQHYTAGNQGRYGWEPLKPEYAKTKAGTLSAKQVKAGRAFGSRLEGGNLPMLVRTGLLRKSVTSGRATVTADLSSGVVNIRFGGLPDYAIYLHDGTGKMPARSPVKPGADDRAQIIEAMKRFLARATGKNAGRHASIAPH